MHAACRLIRLYLASCHAETIAKIKERVIEVMALPEMREKLRRLHVPQQHSPQTRVCPPPLCFALSRA